MILLCFEADPQNGRYTGGGYRYGFNGKEKDSETGIQDYGMRWYLPNIARFPSVDPLTGKYTWLTPYQFAANSPIWAVDIDGLEANQNTDPANQSDMTERDNRLDEIVVKPKSYGFWQGTGRFLKGVGKGIVTGVIGILNCVNPNADKNTIVQLGKAIAHPITTYENIKKAIKSTDWRDPQKWGEVIGNVVAPGALLKVGRLARLGKLAVAEEAATSVGGEVAEAATVAGEEAATAARPVLREATAITRPPVDILSRLRTTVSSQKQARHVQGTAPEGKGFLNSMEDAQRVLDAVHSGEATYLGSSAQGHLIFRFQGVTGTNVNIGRGITAQPTNTFLIKGTSSPSVVPTSPLFTP